MAVRLFPQAPTSGTADLDIVLLDATTLTAPATVFLGTANHSGFNVSTADASGIYEPLRHEVTYIWTVRTSPLSLEDSSLLNMPTAWKNPNKAYGPQASFTFNDPGTYYVDLTAIDSSGNTATDSYQVVVADPDVIYAGTDTIVYSETSTFTGKPTGATEVSTIAALNNAIDAKASGDFLRILFRGGETATFTTQIVANTVAGVALGSFGTGRATIPLMHGKSDASSSLVRAPSVEVKYYDLNIQGNYDAARERGRPGDSIFWRDALCDLMMHRCLYTGAAILTTTAANGNALVSINECKITNWQNMGLFFQADAGGTKYFGVSATSIMQNVDAPQGYLSDREIGNVHGPLRDEQGDNVIIRMCDFFSRNGWSSSGLGGTKTADQPCYRLNSNGIQGNRTTMDRVSAEGGYQVFKIRGQDTSQQDVPINAVFDKILTVGTSETQWHFECHFGGTTIRNWLGVEMNVPKYSYGIIDGMASFGIDSGEETTVNQSTEVSIYNTTALSLLTTANNQAGSVESGNDDVEGIAHPSTGDSAFDNFTNDNNVFHAPNQDTPVTTYAAIDTSTAIAGFTPRYKGVRESPQTYGADGSVTLGSAIAHLGTFTIAYSALLDKDGAATDQAYWVAREAAGDTKHCIYIAGIGKLYSAESQFSVTFGASNVTIRNTSNQTWASGSVYKLKLDQSGAIMAMNTTYSLTGLTVPTARPTSGAAIGTATTGRVAYDDFYGTVRPSAADKGAIEA